MTDWTKRLALSALLGLGTFFFALPVSCGGFVLYNQHLYGDVQRGGPEAVLRALAVSGLLALVVAAVTWFRSQPAGGSRGHRRQ